MLTTVNSILAECDHCGETEMFQDNQDVFNNGWEEINKQLFCKDCIAQFNSLEFKVCEDDQVVCLIDDDSRQLVKDKNYKVNELIFHSDYASEEAKKNLSIYVDVGNGWQAKLDKGQYKLV